MDSITNFFLKFRSRSADKTLHVVTALSISVLTLTCCVWRNRKISLDTKNNLIFITGCDSGFGELIALDLTSQGFKVLATCLTEDGVMRMQSKVHRVIKLNVTNESDIQNLKSIIDDILLKDFCRLWAVINNAGVACLGRLDWVPISSHKKSIDVNFYGVVSIVNALLPFLKKTKESRIINVSSAAGLYGSQYFGSYAASKHALEGYGRSIRAELKPWDIHVAHINPACMKTPILDASLVHIESSYSQASDEIKSQYKLNLNKLKQIMIAEDPMIVVRKIRNLLTERSPAFNHYCGYVANIIRWMHILLPPSIIESILTLSVEGPIPEVKTILRQ